MVHAYYKPNADHALSLCHKSNWIYTTTSPTHLHGMHMYNFNFITTPLYTTCVQWCTEVTPRPIHSIEFVMQHIVIVTIMKPKHNYSLLHRVSIYQHYSITKFILAQQLKTAFHNSTLSLVNVTQS